ncbi:MAG: 3-phosphoshikimate 1-carboxyvinyltransferase [Syntrophothermus sp.]
MKTEIVKIPVVNGTLCLPGDKSISHRAVIFAAMAEGESVIENLSNAEDVHSTIKCFRQLGCEINWQEKILHVKGRGFKGFTPPAEPLDAGNSGTTTRLLSGLLAVQDFPSVIIGDESLSKRPMKRVIEPLSFMGAKLEAAAAMTLPMNIYPSENLHAVNYELKVASAQVKSAVLIAGLHFDEETKVKEFVQTRNHTENLLGLKVEAGNGFYEISSSRKNYPVPGSYFVPSDISTAAFFIVLALLVEGSRLSIKNIGLNESRTGLIRILQEMGGSIRIENPRTVMGEALGDIIVSGSKLHNIDIPAELIPNIIDEIPVLAVAGVFADGEFRISGAKELRFKESDRISAVCENMKIAGIIVQEFEDGFSLSGIPGRHKMIFESYHDHRIAMAFAVLTSVLEQGGTIDNFECVAISNPDFLKQLQSVSN